MPISVNQSGGRVLIRATATESYVVAGNNTVSNICASALESVNSAYISKVYWSGTWAVARGANTVLSLTGNGNWDLAGQGVPIQDYNTAAVSVTGSGTILLQLTKDSNTSGTQAY